MTTLYRIPHYAQRHQVSQGAKVKHLSWVATPNGQDRLDPWERQRTRFKREHPAAQAMAVLALYDDLVRLVSRLPQELRSAGELVGGDGQPLSLRDIAEELGLAGEEAFVRQSMEVLAAELHWLECVGQPAAPDLYRDAALTVASKGAGSDATSTLGVTLPARSEHARSQTVVPDLTGTDSSSSPPPPEPSPPPEAAAQPDLAVAVPVTVAAAAPAAAVDPIGEELALREIGEPERGRLVALLAPLGADKAVGLIRQAASSLRSAPSGGSGGGGGSGGLLIVRIRDKAQAAAIAGRRKAEQAHHEAARRLSGEQERRQQQASRETLRQRVAGLPGPQLASLQAAAVKAAPRVIAQTWRDADPRRPDCPFGLVTAIAAQLAPRPGP